MRISLLLYIVLLTGCQTSVKNTLEPSNKNEEPKQEFDSIPTSNKTQTPKQARTPTLPGQVSFCDKAIPLHRQDIKERLDQELTIMANWHSRTILCIKRANRYFAEISKELKKHNIPDDFKYLAVIESSLDNVVSPRGAAGFWQIMPATAKEHDLIVTKSIDERYDIVKSTKVACEYLSNSYKKLKDWELVAASYNMGLAGISRIMKSQGQKNYYELYLNSETRRYVFRIIAAKILFENPTKYGFNIAPEDLYPVYDYAYDTVNIRKTNWIDFAKKKNRSYYELKLHNPWIRRTNTLLRRSHQFVIRWSKVVA